MTDAPAPPPMPSAAPTLRRYKLTVAYDGTAFHGWQKQEPPGSEPLRTVAGVVEGAIIQTLQQPISLVGSSRTDAGVHARGQVAQFDAATRLPIERMAEALNARLPTDVEIVRAEFAPSDFDAIRQTVSKQYRYRLYNTPHRPLDKRSHVYHCWTPLDLGRMRAAAEKFVGTHDFAGFTAVGHNRLTTERTIHACAIEVDPPEVHIIVQGGGFLYNMVRIIAGTLVEVGRGRFEPEVVDRVFQSLNRQEAGPTLPATGLWLEWISYEMKDEGRGPEGGGFP